MSTPVRVCPYYDAACNELPMKCEFCPERASTASAISDDFRGSTEQLIASITALIELDAAGALVPHGIGGHARGLLAASAVRLIAPTAQPVGQNIETPEPEAWIEHHKGGDNLSWDNPGGKCTPLYTRPIAAVEPSKPAENARLRQIISECAAALGNGSGISPECSVEFMGHLPEEIRAVIASTSPAPAAPNKPARPAWEIQGAIASGAAPMVGSELNEWRPPTLDTTEAINELIDDFMSLAAFSSDPYGTEEEANAKFNRLDLIREKLVAALAASTKGEGA